MDTHNSTRATTKAEMPNSIIWRRVGGGAHFVRLPLISTPFSVCCFELFFFSILVRHLLLCSFDSFVCIVDGTVSICVCLCLDVTGCAWMCMDAPGCACMLLDVPGCASRKFACPKGKGVLHPGCFWCWNLLFGKDNARARQSLGPPEKKVRSRGSPPMSVASTGAGAGAEQLSLEKPAFFYKFAPRLGTLIGGSHFFLLPLGVLYHLQKTTKLFFFVFFQLFQIRRLPGPYKT